VELEAVGVAPPVPVSRPELEVALLEASTASPAPHAVNATPNRPTKNALFTA